MWVLEGSGDIFGHKRLWLRPGRSFLFGRTSNHEKSPTERGFAIHHKGVSRKHLIVSVAPVAAGQSGRVSQKSKLTIEDDSKFGTYLDDNRFIKETRTLEKNEHRIRLGSWEQVIKVTWRPTVLTYVSPKKDVLKAPREKLESCDVKAISEFLFDQTTYVVATKRNLPKVLQGLIGAKHVVTDAYVDAIASVACSPGNAEDGQTPLPSPLEEDFDAHWPDPMGYTPPTSNEPVPRESSYLAPDPERINIFEGFTFVFCTAEQHTQLEPAISLGGAKCPLYIVETGSTSIGEFTGYVRKLAGKVSTESLGDDSPKGVVIVRHQSKESTPGAAEWVARFIQGVDSELDQRSIVQNEFLDAILTKDTSGLKRRLQYEDEDPSPASTARSTRQKEPGRKSPEPEVQQPPRREQQQQPTPVTSQQEPEQDEQPSQPQQPSQPPQPAPTRRLTRRAPTRSRFKGFDDFDEDDDAPAPVQDSAPSQPAEDMEVEPTPPSNQHQATARRGRSAAPESQPLFVSNSPSPSRAGTKRAPPQDRREEPEDPNAAMDALFPGARAAKKRRLERGEVHVTPAPTTPAVGPSSNSQSPSPPPSKAKGKGKKKTENQEDIRTRAREYANQMDKIKEESGDNASEDDVSKLRDLALVEEIDVPALRQRSQNSRSRNSKKAQEGDWDPAWAGRKNFKRFRRKGEGASSERYNRGSRVIVPLEPAKEMDYGIGEHYWSFPSSGSSKKKKSQSQSQGRPRSRRGAAAGDAEEESATQQATGRDSDVEADEEERARLEAVDGDELAGPQREGSVWVSATAGREEVKKGKRPASGAVDESPRKRRQVGSSVGSSRGRARGRIDLGPVMEEDESSDDDVLKFRLRK